MKRLLLTLLILLNLIGYAQTADIVTGCAPLKIQFTAPASSNTYYWDFKDGVTSDKQKPSNLFLAPGIYDVEFREAVGGPIVGKVKITILSKPKLDFTLPQGCAPYNGTFVNTSIIDPAITVTNYKWVFGDGQSFEGLSAPTHLFAGRGSYDVTMQIQTNTMPSCADNVSTTKRIEVLDAPVPNILSSQTVSCDDSANITFNAGNSSGVLPLSYAWTFGNGAQSSVVAPPAQKFKKGQYNTVLSVSYVNIPSCKRDAAVTISIGSPTPKITFSKDSICPGLKTYVRSSIEGLYIWEYSSDAEPKASITRGDSVKFNTPGIHQVKLTVSNGQCSGSVMDTLFVYNKVTAAIDPQPYYECKRPLKVPFKANSNQSDVKYAWSFVKDGKVVDATTQTVERTYTAKVDTNKYNINKADTIYALLVVESKNKCIAKDTVMDIIARPTARIVADKWHGCLPLEIQFESRISIDSDTNKINSIKWNFGDGQSATAASRVNTTKHTFTKPGVYNVTLEVGNERGCLDTSYAVRVEVGDKLDNKIDFSTDKTSVCRGELVTFNVTQTSDSVDAHHFSTEQNRSFHCSDEKRLEWRYGFETGLESVSLEVDYNGCFTKLTKNNLVNIKDAVAQIDYAMDCSKPSEYFFKNASKGATSVSWNFGDGANSTQNNVLHKYNDTLSRDYLVSLTADNGSGCKPSVDQKLIKVRHIKAHLEMDTTLLCANSLYKFKATRSKDVDNSCLRGYTWQFPDLKETEHGKRPHTTADTVSLLGFTDSQNLKKQRVWLITTDVNNCKDTAETRFSVYAITVKSTASKTEICLPNTVEFTDLSTADTTLVETRWSTGDGKWNAGVNPSHLYTSKPELRTPGADTSIYEVQIRVKDALGCYDSLMDTRIKKYIPTSGIEIPDNLLCLGEIADFTAKDFKDQGSKLKFIWDFGNGETSTAQHHTITYQEAKKYDVKLIFEEEKSGCKDSLSTFVDLQSKPHANFTVDEELSDTICAPKILTFKDASISAFAHDSFWGFKNGVTGGGIEYAINLDKGDHEVTHRVATSYGCADDTVVKFKMVRPLGDFSADKLAICKGETVTFQIKDTADVSSYAWFIDGIEYKNIDTVSHPFNFHPPSGQTDVRLVIRGFNDKCLALPTSKTIKIHQVISDYQREDGIDTSICFNNPFYRFINKSSGYDTYAWDFGDGQKSTTEKNPIHKYEAPGAYKVRLSVKSNALGCVDTLEQMALVTLNPVVQAVGDTICQGDGVAKLYVANPHYKSTYKWTPNTGLDRDDAINVTSAVLHTTIYQIIETDSNNCQGMAADTANIIEPLNLQGLDTVIVVGDLVKLPAYKTNLERFAWTPEEGLSCTNCNYPVVRPLKDSVIYNLHVTNVLGCDFEEDVVYKIKVRPETFVKMPTAFTPNSDGHNDVVHVNGWGIKELVEFKVFNRWGQMLYSSSNLSDGWDGKFNGTLQNSDVYVYKVKVKTWRDAEISQEGYINLIH